MKHEWRKHEKEFYIPKTKPELVDLPAFKFYTIEGEGNPNSESFGKAIEALYGASYGIRMMPKKGKVPEGYFEYTVYPLEGVWSLTDSFLENMKEGDLFTKDDFKYKIMIRQPDFVSSELAHSNLEAVADAKSNELIHSITFESICEGLCVQMMHIGSYDHERESFDLMEAFCTEHNLERLSPIHREVYIEDPRKADSDKLKTVLRFKVKKL